MIELGWMEYCGVFNGRCSAIAADRIGFVQWLLLYLLQTLTLHIPERLVSSLGKDGSRPKAEVCLLSDYVYSRQEADFNVLHERASVSEVW